MKLPKGSKLSLGKKDKILISTYTPKPKGRRIKSDINLLKSKITLPKRRRASSDIDIVKNRLKEESGKVVLHAQKVRPHTPIVYDSSVKKISTLSLKVIGPIERFLLKFHFFLFRRRKNARVNTDHQWFMKSKQYQETYKSATESKAFLLPGRKRRAVNEDPKVVLFSFRYPSPYPYIYHRVIHKYVKKDEDGKKKIKKEEKNETKKEDTK